MQKKTKKKVRTPAKQQKARIKLYRWLFSLFVLLILFYLAENQSIESIQSDEVPILYSTACQDNLEKVFVEAIQGAQHSILLIIYSLNDPPLIRALNAQAEKGIRVRVIHDRSTPPEGFQKLCTVIENEAVKKSGLMHQKILVIDSERVWIGSANMTRESLRLHDNLVVGLVNSRLAAAIESHTACVSLTSGGQPIEFWELPKTGKEGLQRLIDLIDGAQKTIRIAMFTWTHSALTDAVIRAKQRGVDVAIMLDRGQAQGVCQQTVHSLIEGGLEPRFNSGNGLLHHKFAWIDEECLINGSANWTQAAFTRNRDCFLIIHQLTQPQNEKMRTLWKKTWGLCSLTNLSSICEESPKRSPNKIIPISQIGNLSFFLTNWSGLSISMASG